MRLIVPKRDQPKEQISRTIPKRNRPAVPVDHARRAKKSAQAAADAGARRKQNNSLFVEAVKRLSQMKPSEAIEYIGTQSLAQQEVHLLAEESDQGRAQVLSSFPKPGAAARARFYPESLKPTTYLVKTDEGVALTETPPVAAAPPAAARVAKNQKVEN